MPFTPFHLGPGYLAAAATAKRPGLFSLHVFALSQVVIDCETLLNILTEAPRLHTFFHTFAGSLAAGALTLLLYRPLYKLVDIPLKSIPEFRRGLIGLRIWERGTPSWKTAALTALLGAWSHVLFDAVDHSDVRPFWPWSGENALHGAVASGDIYLAFFFCGVAALAWRALRPAGTPS